jgi:hypothetical protein
LTGSHTLAILTAARSSLISSRVRYTIEIQTQRPCR